MNFSETIANDTDGWTSSNKFDNSRRIRLELILFFILTTFVCFLLIVFWLKGSNFCDSKSKKSGKIEDIFMNDKKMMKLSSILDDRFISSVGRLLPKQNLENFPDGIVDKDFVSKIKSSDGQLKKLTISSQLPLKLSIKNFRNIEDFTTSEQENS